MQGRAASHPSWVCGLKLLTENLLHRLVVVTPFVGVWIETDQKSHQKDTETSHPSWVCGLKHVVHPRKQEVHKVTPFVGVWIETNQ